MVFCHHYLTSVPSQSACSADSSPKGRAKGCCRIIPPNYNLPLCGRKAAELIFEVKNVILSYFRTLILYLVLILVVRLMGKRQIGEMEPAEFVVTMLVANLASIPMQDGGIPLFSGLVPILTVLGLELVLSWLTLRSQRFRRILCGKPVILIENGNIQQSALRQTRITLDELMSHMRQKDVLNPRDV